jgi:hypothetical protein
MFRLARELGYTVSRLYEELDAREIAEWCAFFKIDEEEREANKKQGTQTNQLEARLQGELRGYKHDGR